MVKRIAWFKEISKDSIAVAGGKGANLGEMFNIGLPVPPGFVVTAQAYAEFVERTNLKDKIKGILNLIDDYQNTELLQAKANEIQKLIIETKMPEDIAEEIKDAYGAMEVKGTAAHELISEGKSEDWVAVRSSATAEDLPEASFAGQQATFLNIKGEDKVVAAVRACWASLFTARAVYYREKNEFDHMKVLISVVIQKMINSEVSGIMFSINPATDNMDEIVIEAGYGLGEAVVSGSINPDLYIVDKETMKIKKAEVKEQDWGIFRDEKNGESIKKDIPEELRLKRVIEDEVVIKLAEFAKKIEEHYGKPQDMEWAGEKGQLFIVQSRAVTTIKKVAEGRQEGDAKTEEAQRKELANATIIIKGESASPGIASGPVSIIHDPSELNKIKKGDVMVTEMTTPDMVPAMQRAIAIVTNEGGLTCIEGDAKIFTNKGFIKMKDVGDFFDKGEQLFTLSLDTQTKKIIWREVLMSMKRRACAIEFSPYLSSTNNNAETIKITPDHKMMLLEGDMLKTESLKSMIDDGHKLLIADQIPRSKEEFDLDLFDKHKLMYLCGSMFSDGHIVKRKSGKPMRVMFSQKVTREKMAFIDTVTTYFSDLFGAELTNYTAPEAIIAYNDSQWTRAASFECSRAEPARTLQTMKDNFVRIISSIEEEYVLSFLAGLIDGDGHFNKEKKWIEIYVNARDEYLLESITIASLRLGIVPKIVHKKENMYSAILNSNLDLILRRCNRVKGMPEKKQDCKLFAAKQLFEKLDVKDWRGNLYNYIKNDGLVGINWLAKYLRGHCDETTLDKIRSLQDSDFRMMRLSPIRETEEIDVFNITVDAEQDEDHNYVVFTDHLTPIIVGNCHAAIVSREMGIPCIVGTEHATQKLKDGDIVTVEATQGIVYAGAVKIERPAVPEPQTSRHGTFEYEPVTATKVKVIMDLPDFAQRAADTDADGVGLMRLEIMIAMNGIHPAQYIRENKDQEYTDMLVKGIGKIASAFRGKPVWVRASDLRTDEYKELKGADQEPKETDPMIGWHAIRRGLDEPRIYKAEFAAIKKLHDQGLTNVGIMIPFVITVDEVRKAKALMREVGLEPCKDVDFGVMCETPASVWVMEDICKEGISFVSFGTNDLTQLTLGVDRNNGHIAKLFDEMHPAVLTEIAHVIQVCKLHGVETSICGQAGSRPEMAAFLVKEGIDSISANPDAVHLIRETVARAEKKLILDAERRELHRTD